jgi:tRNA-binding EMAP/Myf-like protein
MLGLKLTSSAVGPSARRPAAGTPPVLYRVDIRHQKSCGFCLLPTLPLCRLRSFAHLYSFSKMATASAPESSLLSLLYRSYPKAISPDTTELNPLQATSQIFPEYTLSDVERAEIKQWLIKTQSLTSVLAKNDKHAITTILTDLNSHLASRTTLLGAVPSVADIAAYAVLAPVVEKWTPEQRTGEQGYHHIVRHVDFVQNGSLFGLRIPEEEKVAIDVNDVQHVPKASTKEAEDKKKKEKPTTQAADGTKTLPVGQSKAEQAKEKVPEASESTQKLPAQLKKEKTERKEKKEKKEKQPKAAPAPAALPSPSLIDLRVGHILRAINHPNADSLYVSTIDCGDSPGTENTTQDEATGRTVRTVCSGLNGLVPLEEMQGRKIIAVCNLKPVTMRGIKSAAMVLAASPRVAEGEDSHSGIVELVTPPADARVGERVYFEGWSEGEPEKVLNPKKKIWETFQPGFTTTDNLEVAFDSTQVSILQNSGPSKEPARNPIGRLVTQSEGVCTVKSLQKATVR